MKFNYLGKSGLRVSELCLGTATFGPSDVRPGQCTEQEAHRILDAYVESGGNFIDTADWYQVGVAETYVGNWLKERKDRSKLVIATKCGFVSYLKEFTKVSIRC